ncbi:hypothetical protein BCE_2084 [Bacillus cereus ATCC 10987]|uniref:Uncharacterized protein n=1 Tax=Bacillus cereus (strain ATCC 10987 / NRS 248) TaxID=222523 RepID=Q739Q6_BACC1|nr:hypothetical protein BCE_2084 [Bacillus cereus ATCC 10987]
MVFSIFNLIVSEKSDIYESIMKQLFLNMNVERGA